MCTPAYRTAFAVYFAEQLAKTCPPIKAYISTEHLIDHDKFIFFINYLAFEIHRPHLLPQTLIEPAITAPMDSEDLAHIVLLYTHSIYTTTTVNGLQKYRIGGQARRFK